MKVDLGSQGGVVDVADVMLRAHVRNEALTRVATTLKISRTSSRATPFTRGEDRGGCVISASNWGKDPPGKRFLDSSNSYSRFEYI